jgi:beta-aspartyl-peptidase (threonine type)
MSLLEMTELEASSRWIAMEIVRRNICPNLLLLVTKAVLVALPMNCEGMYRGVILEDGIPKTAIFSDEELS